MQIKLQQNSNTIATIILLVCGASLFAYTATRAYLLSITWDEAYSYLEYVRKGIVFQEKLELMSANNHLLNTWLEIQLVDWLGIKEWVLRLPSLLAHLLFLVYSAKLVKHFNNKWLMLCSFLIINLNPYLLDFFSLARGYGLSIGLMMASIYYLYAFNKEFKNKSASLSMLFGALAVLANYVLLNYCMALFVVIILQSLFNAFHSATNASRKFWKAILLPTVIFLLLMAFVVPLAFELREAEALYFGGKKGFWKDTISTIVDRSFYELGYNYWFQRLAKAFMVVIVLSAGSYAIIQIQKKQFTQNKLFLIGMILLSGIVITSTILQHHLLMTLYLMDRTALFLTVLFNIVFVFLMNELSEKKSWTAGIIYISAIVVIVHTCLSFNLSYVLEWKPDANTKEMLKDLERIKEMPKEKNNISLSIPLLFETDINFYRAVNHLTWLNPVTRSKTRDILHDYYYLSQRDLAALHSDSIEILKTYPVTQNVLVRPRFRWKQVRVGVNQQLNFENEPGQRYFIGENIEFSKGFSYIVNDSTTPHTAAVIVFEAKIMSNSVRKSAIRMVITMENKQYNYFWQQASTMDYIKNPGEWVTASFSCIVPKETKAGDKLSMYFWNPDKQELFVKEMHFKWLLYHN